MKVTARYPRTNRPNAMQHSGTSLETILPTRSPISIQPIARRSRGVRNKLDNRCSPQKAWHSSVHILYFSKFTSAQSFSCFSTILLPFSCLRNRHPFHYTSPPFSPLSRLVSLKFPSGLQQPFLSFFSSTVSSPLAVYLVIFSYFSLPPLFPVYDPSFLLFYFFSPSDFPPRRTLFSPSSPLPLHFWPVYGGLIRDFDAETWKSSIETNRLRGPLCVGIGVRHGWNKIEAKKKKKEIEILKKKNERWRARLQR